MEIRENLKKLRGWFPKEPNLLKMHPVVQPPAKNSVHSQGVRIIGVAFIVFGLIGFNSIIWQLGKFSYLPVSTQVLLFASLASVFTFTAIIGGGLMSEKSKWIKAATIFFVVSLFVFYIIPLRAAFPVELLLLIYLGYRRRDVWLNKRVVTFFSAVLIISTICVAFLTPLPLVSAQTWIPKHEVAEFPLISSNDNLLGTVTVYQYNDSDDQHDYYLTEAIVFVVGPYRELNFVNANFSFYSQETVQLTPMHTPQANPAPPITIGYTMLSINIGNPNTVYVYTSSSSVQWAEETSNPKHSEKFSTELIVPQDAHFTLTFSADSGLDSKMFGYIWHDSLTLKERFI